MNVSVIIRAKNEARYPDRVLTRLKEQVYDGATEVIVVDSGSTDGTPAIAGQHLAEQIDRLIDDPGLLREITRGALSTRIESTDDHLERVLCLFAEAGLRLCLGTEQG